MFDPQSRVVAVASTVQDGVAEGLKGTGNVEAAKAVGKAIAERAKAKGITRVAFDRSGFRFTGASRRSRSPRASTGLSSDPVSVLNRRSSNGES